MASTRPSGKAIYLCGLGATIVVYAAYYLRNPVVLRDTFQSLGGLEIGLTVAASLIVPLLGGLWSLVHRPRGLRYAFLVGLGWPAVVFAADLGTELKSVESRVKAMGLPSMEFLAQANPHSPVMRGLRLGLAPVSTVADHRSREAKVERAAAVRERDEALREMTRIEGESNLLEREKGQLAEQVARQKVQNDNHGEAIRVHKQRIAEHAARIAELGDEAQALRQKLEKASSFQADIRRLWPSVRDGWVGAIEHREPEVQRAALRVIESVRPLSSDPAVRVLRRLANTLQDPEIKAEAMRVLETIGSD